MKLPVNLILNNPKVQGQLDSLMKRLDVDLDQAPKLKEMMEVYQKKNPVSAANEFARDKGSRGRPTTPSSPAPVDPMITSKVSDVIRAVLFLCIIGFALGLFVF